MNDMTHVVDPSARNLRRAALLLCCAATVACSTPAVERDAMAEASADRDVTADAGEDRDATTDAGADADASIADAGRDASGDGSSCLNVSGSYLVQGMYAEHPLRVGDGAGGYRALTMGRLEALSAQQLRARLRRHERPVIAG